MYIYIYIYIMETCHGTMAQSILARNMFKSYCPIVLRQPECIWIQPKQ